jgi:hypothetical protein
LRLLVAAFALLVSVLALPAAGGPPVPASLLKKLERDIAGALTHVAELRGDQGTAQTIPSLGAGVDIASSSDAVDLASLRSTLARLRERMAELAVEVRNRGDPRLDYVVHLMQQELGELIAEAGRIAALPDPRLRDEAVGRLERGLVQLDGATAALWTFEP